MKENKFRGFDPITKKFIYGNLLFTNETYCIIPFLTNGCMSQKETMLKWINPCYQVVSETVGQYTGLHDDSDDEKEVYENDIILINYETDKIKAIVKFERGTFILASDEFIDGYIPLFEVSESDREYEWINGVAIGNIHEKEK